MRYLKLLKAQTTAYKMAVEDVKNRLTEDDVLIKAQLVDMNIKLKHLLSLLSYSIECKEKVKK